MRPAISPALLLAFVAACLFSPLASAEEVFEFESVSDGKGFDGQINAPSTSGNFFLKTESRSAVQEDRGRIFLYIKNKNKPDDAVIPITATFNVLNAKGAAVDFTVSSLAWRSVEGRATLKGMKDGREVWRFSDAFNRLEPMDTVSEASQGDLSKPIDSLVWEFKDYVNGTFGSAMDDLSINVVSPSQ
ncbi:MAG: hypothetical protein AAF750_00630 [Planctomycetota bacterium]